MGGKKPAGGGEGSKKAQGQARKADAAASKAAAGDAKREAAEAAEWNKGAKSNAKQSVPFFRFVQFYTRQSPQGTPSLLSVPAWVHLKFFERPGPVSPPTPLYLTSSLPYTAGVGIEKPFPAFPKT